MKKIILSIICLSIALGVNAQKSKVVSAWNYLQSEEYDKAKNAIDEAANNEDSKTMYKCWYYRGLVYQALNEKGLDKVLAPNAIDTAVAAYEKCVNIKPKNEFAEECINRLRDIRINYSNQAFEAYNAEKFDVSYYNFAKRMSINDFLKANNSGVGVDTQTLFNTALLAQKINKNNEAKPYLEQLCEVKYKDAYVPLANLYKADKDTAKAMTLIEQGIASYPKEKAFIDYQINTYIQQNKLNDAIVKLNHSISLDPKNPDLYYVLGTAYENINKIDDARNAYNKALEFAPENFDINLALGISYFNDAVIVNKKMNALGTSAAEQKQFDQLTIERNAIFDKAFPFLNKANTINPENEQAATLLKKVKTFIAK